MSGGSLDYAYEKVNDAADAVRRRAETSLHRAFAKHLDRVSAAPARNFSPPRSVIPSRANIPSLPSEARQPYPVLHWG